MIKQLLTCVLLLCSVAASCTNNNSEIRANYQVIPMPQDIIYNIGQPFILNRSTKIVVLSDNTEMQRNAQFLADYIAELTGFDLAITTRHHTSNAIILTTNLSNDNSESYRLTVNKKQIAIAGASPAGVFYGIQTLRKSIPTGDTNTQILFPPVNIFDQPRFAYRGAHLDVCRHFFPTDSVKKYIDMLALHNINRFHWHLSEDQGWRIEIKSRPLLTEIGAFRNGTQIGHSNECDTIRYGGFYTQDEAREIVKYAAERYITVIPEIDMPGHMRAALASYPEIGCTGGPYEVRQIWYGGEDVLCAGSDEALKFIDDVLGEIVEIFPSKYIHIGGDECPKGRWKECPKCQARINELGLHTAGKYSPEERLQSFVTNHAEQFLNSKGRLIIGWDEILEGGLTPNATVMSWRGEEGGIEAARQRHDVIMSPNSHLYFDHWQTQDIAHEPVQSGGYTPVETVYNYEPVPTALNFDERQFIKGVQANMWTEYVADYPNIEYMVLPRFAALCEVQWTASEKKNYANFLSRLPQLLCTYNIKGYNYAKHLLDVNCDIIQNVANKSFDVKLSTLGDAPIYYTTDGSTPTERSMRYVDVFSIDKSCVIKAIAIHKSVVSRLFVQSINVD